MNPATFWLGRIAGLLVVLGLGITGSVLLGSRESQGQRIVRQYVGGLARSLRFIRSPVKGVHILIGQAVLGLGVSAYALCQREALWLLPWPAVILAPKVFLNKAVARRVSQVEAQVEAWVNAVANALKASPSLGEAICSTTTLVPAPMSQELDVLVKEYELGTPLDQALENLGKRINSKVLNGTVTALKIARRSGGNLTEMLETAAGALREFARLEGVVRTKTAEGKAQAFVIGMIPIPMVLGVRGIDPRFFEPLFHSFLGQLIVAAAAVLWVLAIVLSRKILDVDI
jgi:tight adherence protein B